MKQISSADNPSVKLVKKLVQKKYRDETGLFLVEGLRACELAVASPYQIDSFWLSESFLRHTQSSTPFWEAFPCCCISDKIFSSLSDTQSPQGILCTAKIPQPRSVFCGKRYLYLDNVRDPGNVGTIVRTADALGFEGVFLSEGCADLYSPKTVRSTMGSVFSVETAVGCPYSLLSDLKRNGYQIVASALTDSSFNLYRAKWSDKLVFVLGNEANGVSREILDLADMSVKIPMYGKAESFNVSIAAALMMGEAMRRIYETE